MRLWTYAVDAGDDARYACRTFLKAPGFAATVILTLTLAIGANTAVFSVIEGVLLKPLPYRDPERLVAVWDKSNRESALAKIFGSYGDLQEFSKHSTTLEEVAGATWALAAKIIQAGGPARTALVIPVS